MRLNPITISFAQLSLLLATILTIDCHWRSALACAPPLPSHPGGTQSHRGLVDPPPTPPAVPLLPNPLPSPPSFPIHPNPSFPVHPNHAAAVRMSPAAVARVYGVDSQQASGPNSSPVQIEKAKAVAGGAPSINEPYELYCGDFDERCRWRNLEGLFVDELDWYQGAGFLDEARLRLATGTHIRPDGYYGIAATDKVEFPNAKAVLVSDVIDCQLGMAELRFQYWTSPQVRIVVCTKSLLRLYPDYDFCSQPVESGDPGPASISLPDLNGHAFQIYLRAENFVFHNTNLQGGFAIIDNIEYNGVLCPSASDNDRENESAPPPPGLFGEQKASKAHHVPANTILPPLLQPPKLAQPSRPRNHLSYSTHTQHGHRGPKEPLPVTDGSTDDVHRANNTESPTHLSPTNGLTLKSMSVHRRDPAGDSHPPVVSSIYDPYGGIYQPQFPAGGGAGHWGGYPYPLFLASATTQTADPTEHSLKDEVNAVRKLDADACFALNCSFDDHCAEYVLQKGVEWQVSRRPVGNPLTGIRGDASSLPYNKDGTFVYAVGPKVVSRFSTRPFTLYKGAYLMFAYHKVARKAELRMLVKRVGAEQQEEVLFEAPRLAIESRRWFREVRRLAADSYAYLAFEVQNLPPNTYIGVDELVLLGEETREPLCKSPVWLNNSTNSRSSGPSPYSTTPVTVVE